MPTFADRVRAKVRAAAPLVGVAVDEVLAALPTGGPLVLCHGDLHPGNVILTSDGPMLVDWFDTGRGDPIADVARSTLLMAPDVDAAPRHLPGGAPELRQRLTDAYVEALGDLDASHLARWRAVMAIARVAEGVASDGLVAVWRSWSLTRHGAPMADQRLTSTSRRRSS